MSEIIYKYYFRSSPTLTTRRTYKKTGGISTSPIIIGRNEGSLNQRNVNTQDTYWQWSNGNTHRAGESSRERASARHHYSIAPQLKVLKQVNNIFFWFCEKLQVFNSSCAASVNIEPNFLNNWPNWSSLNPFILIQPHIQYRS